MSGALHSPASIDTVQGHFDRRIAVSQNRAMRWRASLPCRGWGVRPARGSLALAVLVAGLALGCGETEPAPPLGGVGRSTDASCDVYASTQGSDSASGGRASPLRTPVRLLGALDPGQTGCFRGGTYAFSLLEISTPGITLAPYRDEAVTLEGEIKVLPGGAGSTIQGMKLNGAGGESGIGPRINADNVVVRDNEITNDHTSICVSVSSWYSRPPPRGVVIERNRIHDCGRLPSTNMDHGVYVVDAVNTVIRDNWIYGNADRGIQLYPDAQRTRIVGNVIDGNGDGVIFGGAGGVTSNHNLVKGNVITNSNLGWNVASGPTGPTATGNLVLQNCLWAGDSKPFYRSNGGIQAPSRNFTAKANTVVDPEYADRSAHDYALSSDSPCPATHRPDHP
jgi:hypothetical protein